MSKSLTKAQLLSELEAARIEIQRLSALVAAQPKRTATVRPTYKRVLTPEQEAALEQNHSNYVRALLAAKELAMRTGRTVRVGD